MQRLLVCVVVGALLSLLAVVPVLGQGAVAEINGTVLDATRAVFPGVAITLIEETTGLVRTAIANETGHWILPALQPGRYTIKGELAGFQTQTLTGVIVNVGQSVTINLTLPVGSLSD
jgi:hypothetical protein